ncbi:hypothetical protein [Nitrosopumilus sp.]|nr:hypothetical protein [Nitrosopumilus sp.]
MLDDKKLEDDQVISKNNSIMSILLDKYSKYDIVEIIDDDRDNPILLTS